MARGAEMRTSRREFLQLATAGAALAATSGVAQADLAAPPKPLAPVVTVNLGGPDFGKLKAGAKYIARVRPHRNGGVRLERADPVASPGGIKQIIHNYGHSGAGITLSFGCAAEVVRLVRQVLAETGTSASPPPVAILGTGIIGLTVATELRRAWPALALNIYAKDLNIRNTTSYFAGGQFAPSQIFKQYKTKKDRAILIGYLKGSQQRLEEIAKLDPGGRVFGVKKAVRNYSLFPDDALDLAIDAAVLADARAEVNLSLNNTLHSGHLYRTWLMDPTILLPKLAADLNRPGVKFVKKTFKTREDILALGESIIINCTGYGAAALMQDADMEPHRGHLVVLKNPAKLDYLFSGGCGLSSTGDPTTISYLFARQNDIVVGGTVSDPAPGDKENYPKWYKAQERDFFDARDPADVETASALLANAAKIFSGAPETCKPPPSASATKLTG